MNQALLDAILRADFENFLRKCTVSLSPGEPFIHNWHIRALAWHLEQVRLGKIKRLIINMPPRSLKSIAASVAFPAFVLGHDPTRRIICVSYGIDLAIKHANDFRAIIEAPWYRRLFPLMQLSGTKNTETEVATTQHGFRTRYLGWRAAHRARRRHFRHRRSAQAVRRVLSSQARGREPILLQHPAVAP